MYNGIGLATPRGSGTNGHVQRNWALVKPRIKEKTYKSEQELETLDTVSNRQPNKEILDHERKRKIELKCAEFADILEEQGFTPEAINSKINNYRSMLLGQTGKQNKPIDQWERPCVTETHQVAEAQQEKNARLREAFGISEYFVDGSSFDPDREAKEKLAKSVALFEKEKHEIIEREKQREQEKFQAAQYQLVHTPSPEPAPQIVKEVVTKKKKRKRRNSTSSEEPKKKKKKNRKKDRSGSVREKRKKKKHKKDLKKLSSTSENESTSEDESKKSRKKEKRITITSRKKKHPPSEGSRGSSAEPSSKLGSNYLFKNDQRNKLRKKKKTVESYCDYYLLDSKTSSKSVKNSSKLNRSRSPHSKKNRLRRNKSPLNDSKDRSDVDSSRSRKLTVKRRSRSREIRKKLKSRSLERRKSLSPESLTKKSNKSDEIIKRKNKRELSEAKSKVLDKCRKSRSRSLDDKNRHKNYKSLSRERRPRSNLSKSPGRSQLVSQKLTSEKYFDKKDQLEQLSKSKSKRTNSITFSYERKRRKSLSPNRDNPEQKNRSPRTRKRERSLSPNQFDKKRSKSPKNNKSSSVKNDENTSDCENFSYEKSNSPTKYCCHMRNRDNSIEEDVTYKSREHSTTYNVSRKVSGDKNSLTPDLIFSSANSPKSRSNTPDIKRNVKQKETSEKHLKSMKPLPVVRLRASSNEADSSDVDIEKEEEADDKEINILKLLKTDLAAKAKESLERKKEKPPSPQPVVRKEIEPDFFDIKMLPVKFEKEISSVMNKDEFNIEQNGNNDNSRSKAINSSSTLGVNLRSRSSSHCTASSKEGQRSKSSSRSTISPSRSRTVSRSRSQSSSMSSSSESSTTTRSRSPSIPRRHGSPSFLDRRRITSARKRPIPYARPSPSSPSSVSSYNSGSPYYTRRRTTSDSVTPRSSRSASRSPIRSSKSP